MLRAAIRARWAAGSAHESCSSGITQQMGTRFGIALGGGGARGMAHIGVMQVLEAHNMRPTVFAGTSIGGLLGAFFAAGKTAAEMEELARHLNWTPLWEWRPGCGLLNFDGLETLLNLHLPKTFEELEYPLAVTATDLSAGVPVYLHSGNLHEALQATIAFPGAIDPIWVNGRLLADGGILNQIPVDAARFLGAETVLAVDITAPMPLSLEPPSHARPSVWERVIYPQHRFTPLQTAWRAVELMQAQMTRLRLAASLPEVVVRPELQGIGLESFWKGPSAVEAGCAAAEDQINEIRQRCLPQQDIATN